MGLIIKGKALSKQVPGCLDENTTLVVMIDDEIVHYGKSSHSP